MNNRQMKALIQNQRVFFRSGATLDVRTRIRALTKLKECILRNEKEIAAALKKDLGKSGTESYMCEIGMTLNEISYMLRHIVSFSRGKTRHTPLAQFPAKSIRKPSPYGVVLIMSPWNYPFLLTMEPLVDALAAGNTAVVKPSAYSPHTSALITKLLSECFGEHYVAVVTGGRKENAALLEQRFDYIFFTGSKAVGQDVLRHAAENLTPVTLELGGKSPCIVEKSANLRLAARRIVFGKFLNCGQTCVAPDYIYCDVSVKDKLIREICREIKRQFGEDPLANPNYGRIVNKKHFRRLRRLMDPAKIVHGGKVDPAALRIAPTVMDNVTFRDAVMKEEIFGPILPILTYDSLEMAVQRINSMPTPLAFYLFTENQYLAKRVTGRCRFGGGCVNDTIIHLATNSMGFGGLGESGMGSYHGEAGFDTFSHYKSIVDKKTWLDLPMRYQPYRSVNDWLIRKFLK
ncbi:MAG: aldehyde dehydrogenase [Candidatus Gastranaerophilales bacterium]|nr:aldehyde dehydrogenase [Candidatus Gastranaerophilales bacterium]